MKPKILIFVGYYTPSIKAGGPVQSIKNIVENMSDKFDFYIITSDRDLGDDKPFQHIVTEKWLTVNNSNILYLDQSKLTIRKIKNIIQSINFDILYLNSFFSNKFSIKIMLMQKLGILDEKLTIVAPRGEFSHGALSLKTFKKNFYIRISRFFNIYESVIWHATTKDEKKDVEKVFGPQKRIKVANNLTENYNQLAFKKKIFKESGDLKLIFLGRIHPTKNLKKCIECLFKVKGRVTLEVYGPVEDKAYWQECKNLIHKLNNNITVKWYGTIKHDEIMNKMYSNHILILPTLGENFGHVISEGLVGGCPVIISDQTPWRNLEENSVGWDINLNNNDKFISTLQYCIDLNQENYNQLSKNAFEFGKKKSNTSQELENYRNLFLV